MSASALLAREIAALEQLRIARARNGLLNFTCFTKPDYQVNWHHRLICLYLNKIATGKISRLMINVQPRAGKSELVSRRFPAFYLGCNPNHQMIAASYNATLAQKMNRDVQRIITLPAYNQIFPNVGLNAANIRTSAQGNWIRNADEFEVVGHRGSYRAAGVGGATTGYGANCLAGSTLISTELGKVRIDQLVTMRHRPRVWSYNHEKRSQVLSTIEAVHSRKAADLVSVRVSDGRLVTCTPEHLFYTGAGQWRPAAALRPGQAVWCRNQGQQEPKKTLVVSVLPRTMLKEKGAALGLHDAHEASSDRDKVRSLSGAVSAADVHLPQGPVERAPKALLQQPLCISRGQRPQGGLQKLLTLSEGHEAPFEGGRPSSLLHTQVQERCSPHPQRAITYGQAMPFVRQNNTQAYQSIHEVLQQTLRKSRTLGADADRKESVVDRWKLGGTIELSQNFLSTAHNDYASRQAPMLRLWPEDQWAEGACTSYRQQARQQRIEQFDYDVCKLSHHRSQGAHAPEISTCGDSESEYVVYDIQVADTHCYFAEGILVHNCAIIDDPVKNRDEANSHTFREKVWDWYTSTLYTRLEKDGRIVLCMTRWHEDDLAGRLLERARKNKEADQWTVLSLPSVHEGETADYDPRKKGDALWPEKYSLKRLHAMRQTMGEKDWVSLYQQRPAPATGNLIRVSWWKYWTEMPADFDLLVASADLSFNNDTGKEDFTVFTVWGRAGNNFYLLDMVRDRMNWLQQKRAMLRLVSQYPDLNAFYIENAALGAALVAEARQVIPGVIAVTPKGGKASRLEAVSGLIEAGNVWLPDPETTGIKIAEQVVSEMAVFPNGANDDIVDSVSQALNQMRRNTSGFVYRELGLEKEGILDGLKQV